MDWYAGALIATVLGALTYGREVQRVVRAKLGRPSHTTHHHGVCMENDAGWWGYLKLIGLTRELGLCLSPDGHDRFLTTERGAYRPRRVDSYYWFKHLIWQTARGEPQTEDHALRNSAIAILISVISKAFRTHPRQFAKSARPMRSSVVAPSGVRPATSALASSRTWLRTSSGR